MPPGIQPKALATGRNVTGDEPASTVEEGAAELAAADVESVLMSMSKALRAYQMYQANNPVFQRFQSGLREEIARLWDKADGLELGVEEGGFRYQSEVYNVSHGRGPLAFAFYKDGIRYLKFLPGFEDEVGDFLLAIRRSQQRDDDADDMVSVLWDSDFTSLQYGFVDMLGEGVRPPDVSLSEPGPLETFPVLEMVDAPEAVEMEDVDGGGAGSAERPKTVSADDFDETLYFLDPAETAALQREVEREMERDLRTAVLHALFDRLEEDGRPERQSEIMDILDQLLPLFLARGDMGSAARVLGELDQLVAEGGEVVDAALAERIDLLFRRLGDPEVLEQFVQAMEAGEVTPGSEDVALFFSRLPAGALPVLMRFAEVSETPGVREQLASAIDGLAARYPADVAALLSSKDATLVKAAAQAAGRVGLSQAVTGLREALAHPYAEVRLAVVQALVAIRLTPALHALQAALDDEDREVRLAAVRALGAVRFASAREALAAALDDRRMKDADLTEKMAFYEAYGALGGNAAVERLDEILNDKGFLGRRAPAELRACAALGLAKVGTPAARDALERGNADDDPIVRNAVSRALRREGE
jgi:HEAT repeat protein